MGFRPFFPGSGNGGTGGGRSTFTPDESPFVDIAERDTWAAANLNELFNSETQVTEVITNTDLYRWSGDNQPSSYNANQFLLISNNLDATEVKTLYESNSNTNAFTDSDETASQSVVALPENAIPMATATGLTSSIMTQPDNSGIMADGEISSSRDSVNIGEGLTLSEDGGAAKLTDRIDNIEALAAGTLLNNDGTTGLTVALRRSNPTNVVVQPFDDETRTGDWFAWVPVTATRIIEDITIRHIGTASQIRLVLRDSPDQSTTTGPVLYQSHTETQFAAGEGLTFTDGNNNIPFENGAKLVQGRFVYIQLVQNSGGTGQINLRGRVMEIAGVTQFYNYLEQQTLTEEQVQIAMLEDIEHPVTLRRDMPSQEDSLALANASLNNNSALWIVANDQLANSNRNTATIQAQRAGIPDLNGNDIPTTPTDASTIQMRSGTIVRVFGQDEFRVVSAPLVESDLNGGIAPPPQARFTRFEFQSQPTSVAPGTTISGSKTFLFRVERPDLLTGTLTIRQGLVVLSENTIQPSDTSATVTITTETLQNAGNSASFTISGTLAAGGTITSTVTIRAVAPHELAYYGIRPTDDFSSVALSELSSTDITANNSFDVTGAFANGSFIGILVPSDMDLNRITTLATPVTSSFTRTENARTINSQTYILYTLQNNGGIDGQAAYTVEI